MASIAEEKQNLKWSSWLHKALLSLKPPEKLTVSEWADRYRILDSKTSAEPGKWKTSRTPYLKEIMDSFNDPEVEELAFVKPTQVGGTEKLNNIISYIIAQDQAPTLVVYPTEKLAEYTSTNRLQPMIKLSEATRKHFYEAESKILELQFDAMYLVLSGANSPSSLASRPMKNLLCDEIDKYPSNAGKEADPISLARERTRTFTHSKKIVLTSTPTLDTGPIHQAWLSSDSQYEYYVTCPFCGQYQTLKFPQIKWPKEAKTSEQIRESAYYQCELCEATITDNYKPQMLRSGEWRAIKEDGRRKVAYRINALYSPWVKFGQIAAEFIEAKAYPEKLMNFVNSVLAEPWIEKEASIDENLVLERQTELEEGVIPNKAKLLVAGVDVQDNSFYYTIRAWGAYSTSWNITHGQVESWEDIEYIMNLPYYKLNGQRMQVQLCCIDTGYKAEEVYDFCAQNYDWCKPIKGASRPLLKRFSISSIDKTTSKAHGMNLYIVDTGQYKDMITARLRREKGKGSFMTFKNCDQDYAKQLCSEHKVKDRKKNLYVWQKKPGHKDNHYLDCEVYGCLAADLLGVRYLQDDHTPAKKTEERPEKEVNSWIDQDNWINHKGSWL